MSKAEVRATKSTPDAQPAMADRSLFRKLKPGPGKSRQEVAAHQRARIEGAMTEIVSARGYRAVTVRELAKLAGVSTRAFYKQFADKQECFVETYEEVIRYVARRILEAEDAETDGALRLQAAFRAFAREIMEHPKEARLALLEAPTLGPLTAERTQRASRLFEAMIRDAFRSAPGEVAVLPLVVKGIVGGATGIAAARLLSGREEELPGLAAELSEWALGFRGERAADLALLASPPGTWAAPAGRVGNGEPAGDVGEVERRLMLAAVGKVVRTDGYAGLTAARISAAAGVSRQRFRSQFDSPDECFLEAVEMFTDRVIGRAVTVAAEAPSWEVGVYRGVTALCHEVAGDPMLARIGFTDLAGPGVAGTEHRVKMTATLAKLVCDSTSHYGPEGRLRAEASVAGAWTILDHQVASGRSNQIALAAPVLSLMLLAPAIGAPAALQVMRTSQ